MSVIRLFRLGVRAAEWATPYVKEWHRKRHLHRTEGQRHLKAHNWREAEEHLTKALASGKHGGKHLFELLAGLANAQRQQGNFAGAEKTIGTALEFGKTSRNHDWQMQALDEMAELQLAQQNYAGAQESVEKILTREGARHPPDKARMAVAGRKLATALVNAGENERAIGALGRAVRLAEEGFGPEDPGTAGCLAELGALHRARGEHEQAQRCLRQGLAIYRKAGVLDSHEATRSLFELANSLVDSGNPDGACSEFERVLTLKERQIGGNPEETAEAQVNLAALYLQVGRDSAARELLLRAVGVLDRKGGERMVRALELLIVAEEAAGRSADAKSWREKLARLQAVNASPVSAA